MSALLFNLFAFLAVGSALAVVFNKNTVNSAMFLMLSLVAVAGLFALLDAGLLAILLVFVYAGAVVALFLFIVMLLDTQGGSRKPFKKATVAASIAGAGLLVTGADLLCPGHECPAGLGCRGDRAGGRGQPAQLRRAALYHLPAARADRRLPAADRHAGRHCAEQALRRPGGYQMRSSEHLVASSEHSTHPISLSADLHRCLPTHYSLLATRYFPLSA